VPIEEVARCQYKTFRLNLQTITITLDVVKWRGGGVYCLNLPLNTLHNIAAYYCVVLLSDSGWFYMLVTAFVTPTKLRYVDSWDW